MKSLKNSFFIGLTAVAMATGASVYAQSPAPSPGPAMGKPGGMGMHGPEGMDHAKMAERMKAGMEKHQKELHDKLKLTAAQEPAWKTFTDAIAPEAMAARPDRAAMEKLTAPERMEKMLALSKERQAKMEGHLAALKTFYAVLTPEQKKILDASHSRMDGHRMQGGKHERSHKH
ncbi:MAG: Spy/CpxP family protein refolding chaperone [Undibacterium sp.]|nr:Spy/CpxP family protein refolding chaperone [Undibacterium sp.]